MAVNLAKEIDADLVMASDPDADRVGIACKDDKGEWVLINGNQTCMMYLYYILTQYKQLGKIKGGEFCVKTIVTTELIKKIADKNNIEMLDCYTGLNGLPVKSVCVKANRNISVAVKKATDSLPKISFAIKMPYQLAV